MFKKYKNNIINDTVYKPKLYKKGKLWLVSGITMFSLISLGGLRHINVHADTTGLNAQANQQTKTNANQPINTKTISNQANVLHKQLFTNNAMYLHSNNNSSNQSNTGTPLSKIAKPSKVDTTLPKAQTSTTSGKATQNSRISSFSASSTSNNSASPSTQSNVTTSKVSSTSSSNNTKLNLSAIQSSFANQVNDKGLSNTRIASTSDSKDSKVSPYTHSNVTSNSSNSNSLPNFSSSKSAKVGSISSSNITSNLVNVSASNKKVNKGNVGIDKPNHFLKLSNAHKSQGLILTTFDPFSPNTHGNWQSSFSDVTPITFTLYPENDLLVFESGTFGNNNGTWSGTSGRPFIGNNLDVNELSIDTTSDGDGNNEISDFKNAKYIEIQSDVKLPNSLANMFANNPNLRRVKIDANTSNVTNMSGMFENDPKLSDVELGNNWSTWQVGDMSNMFAGDTSLKTLRIPNDASSNNKFSYAGGSIKNMFGGDINLTHIIFPAAKGPYSNLDFMLYGTNIPGDWYYDTTTGGSHPINVNNKNATGLNPDGSLKLNLYSPTDYRRSQDIFNTISFHDIYSNIDSMTPPASITEKVSPNSNYSISAPDGWALVNPDGSIASGTNNVNNDSKQLNSNNGNQTLDVAPVYRGLTYKYNYINPTHATLEFTGGKLADGYMAHFLMGKHFKGSNPYGSNQIMIIKFDKNVDASDTTTLQHFYIGVPNIRSVIFPTNFGQNVKDTYEIFKDGLFSDNDLQSLTLYNPSQFSQQLKQALTTPTYEPYQHLYRELPEKDANGKNYTTGVVNFFDNPISGTYVFKPNLATTTIKYNNSNKTIHTKVVTGVYGSPLSEIIHDNIPSGYYFVKDDSESLDDQSINTTISNTDNYTYYLSGNKVKTATGTLISDGTNNSYKVSNSDIKNHAPAGYHVTNIKINGINAISTIAPNPIHAHLTINYRTDGHITNTLTSDITINPTSNTYTIPSSIMARYIKDTYTLPNTTTNITASDISTSSKNITLNFNTESAGDMVIHYYDEKEHRDVSTVSYTKQEVHDLCPYTDRFGGFHWDDGEQVELAPYADREFGNPYDNITGEQILYILGCPGKPVPYGTHLLHTVNPIMLLHQSTTSNIYHPVAKCLSAYVTFK